MTDEIDATELNETETAEAVEEVVAEQSEETQLDSSTNDADAEPEKGVEKRIGELTKKQKDAERQTKNVERERDYWRDQASKDPEPTPAPVEEVKTLADFDYDEGLYQTHILETAQKGINTAVQAALQKDRETQSSQRAVTNYKSNEAEFAETVDDYDKVARNKDLQINQPMADTIKSMETGPAVLYYLGKNQDIADNIAQLSPKAAERELYRIEMKLEQSPKAEKVSKAPAPPPKIAGVESKVNINPSKGESDDLSTEEWMKRRNKQLMRK